jgi:hypothetical protein
MTRAAQRVSELEDRISELEESILNSVELLDNCDGSRSNLVNTLDEVRETLVNSYGDNFQEEYNEMLGIETEDEEIEEVEEEEEE